MPHRPPNPFSPHVGASAWQTGYDQGIAQSKESLTLAIDALKAIQAVNHDEYGEISDTAIERIVKEALAKLQ